MPLYLGSYIADTLRFTTEQHGAYLLLIMDYWRNGPPPDDDQVLAQIAKLAVSRWKAHRVVIAPKFQVSNGVWKHKRIEHELGRAKDMQEALSERGKAGAAARWNKDSPSNAAGNATAYANGNAQAMPADAPVPLPGPLQAPRPGPRPLPESKATAPPTRTGAIALLLRTLGNAQGKTVRVASIDKRLMAWAEKGITDEQITGAFELALQDREAKNDATAITPGFVDVFLAKLLNPPAGATRVNGHGKPWFIDTWQAIVSKGAEKGLKEANFATPPEFRAAVFEAHGVTRDEVRKAEADWKETA